MSPGFLPVLKSDFCVQEILDLPQVLDVTNRLKIDFFLVVFSDKIWLQKNPVIDI